MSTACCLKRQHANEQAVATVAAYPPYFCASVQCWQVQDGYAFLYKRILADSLADNQRLGHLPVLRPGGLDL